MKVFGNYTMQNTMFQVYEICHSFTLMLVIGIFNNYGKQQQQQQQQKQRYLPNKFKNILFHLNQRLLEKIDTFCYCLL